MKALGSGFKWHKGFLDGHEIVEEGHCCGQPRNDVNVSNVAIRSHPACSSFDDNKY